MIVYLKRWLLPLLTLFMVGSGAVLPYAVSSLQDSFAETHVETRQFATVNLTLQQSLSIAEVMQLISHEYSWFNYEGQTNLTSSEALQAAREALQAISEEVRPCPVNTNSETEIELGLVMQNDNSEASAIIWMCYFDNLITDSYIVMIDDASGKMVKFVATSSQQSVYYTESYAVDSTIMVEYNDDFDSWKRFCQKYYGFNIIDGDEIASLDTLEYIFMFLSDDADTTYYLSVVFMSGNIVFNAI